MSNRKIYNSDQSVAESRLTRYRTAVATFKSYLEKAPLSGIFCEYMILEPMKYRHLELIVREHIISGMDAHESDFVEFMLWHEVMSLARIGYGINGGCTGEENEYAIPMIIAKFILKKSVEYQKWCLSVKNKFPAIGGWEFSYSSVGWGNAFEVSSGIQFSGFFISLSLGTQ